MILSQEQLNAFDSVLEWLKTDKQVLVIGGFAGTGKTTVSRKLQDELGCVAFGAFTGKAVNVLRDKGCKNVSTIHSLIYRPIDANKQPLLNLRREIDTAAVAGDTFIMNKLVKDYEALEEKLYSPKFELNSAVKGGFIIVDEYSMLDENIVNDLLRTYKKILFMGDPFQLPPVSGNCPLVPSMTLETIHRQAEGSSILKFATKIRNMEYFTFGDWGDFSYMPMCDLSMDQAYGHDQIICGRNATRWAINDSKRSYLGIKGILPIAGEEMMCLRNNKDLNIFNGMTLTVEENAHKLRDIDNKYIVKFKELKDEIMVWEGDILGKKFKWSDKSARSLQRFDYCHAITAHKSQGSEYNSALVIKEPIGDDDTMRSRWLYTAITRGKEKVTLVMK